MVTAPAGVQLYKQLAGGASGAAWRSLVDVCGANEALQGPLSLAGSD